MNKLILNIRVAGCPNQCFHCHSCGGNCARGLIDVDTVLKTASFFRDGLDTDVTVLLLDEQTFYPDFIKLVTTLESEGFIKKDPSKILVTNCWGLEHIPRLIDDIRDHYSTVIPTLFGIGETHDLHSHRKGSYFDIIESTKKCIKNGVDTFWHLQWSRLNTGEIDRLFELGKSLGVNKIIISAEYLFSGRFPEVADQYLPLLIELDQIEHEIFEYQQGILKTVAQFREDIQKGKIYSVKKVSLDELYIDEHMNAYPFLHLLDRFKLGNLNDSSNKIIEQVKYGSHLPEAIIRKRDQDFLELVAKYADISSDQLYTPQSLFDRLCMNIPL